jgi:hypothetical protein
MNPKHIKTLLFVWLLFAFINVHAQKILFQKGILSDSTEYGIDADVIITAAILGHSNYLIDNNWSCVYYYDGQWDKAIHDTIGMKLNFALREKTNGKVLILPTPAYNSNTDTTRIYGGTGHMDIADKNRYQPARFNFDSLSANDAAAYNYALKTGVDQHYNDRGAYTGSIQGATNGNSKLLFWTYRHPAAGFSGVRHIPEGDSVLVLGKKYKTGSADSESVWGTILHTNSTEIGELKNNYHMVFMQDYYTYRSIPDTKITDSSIVGYVHGMIQAIYQLESWKINDSCEYAASGDALPVEIAVGQNTTKLASCFGCTIFMEANGYPASASHLGYSQSWSPSYLCEEIPESPEENNLDCNTLLRARFNCNDKWAAYCEKIIKDGIKYLKGNLLNEKTHLQSFNALEAFINSPCKNDYAYANLILDAFTHHSREYERINRTLILK